MDFPDLWSDIHAEIQLGGVWVDVSEHLLRQSIQITRGRQDEQAQVQPSGCSLVLDNPDGRYTPDLATSPYYPHVRRGARLRLRLDLGEDPVTALSLPGVEGSYASTPSTAALQITGDVDVRVEVTPATWRPPDAYTLAGRYEQGGDNRSWILRVRSSGVLTFSWSPDGTFTNLITVDSTSAVPDDGARRAVRAALDVDDGGDHTVTFYTADSIDGSWVQLGSAVTDTGTTTVHAGDADLEVGSANEGGSGIAPGAPVPGLVHALQLYDATSVVAEVDLTGLEPGQTSVTDTTGLVWSLHGSAEIIDTDLAPLLLDSFARTETNGWGAASSGQTYATTGTASDYAVSGGTGQITITSHGDTRAAYTDLGEEDFEALFDVYPDIAASGDGLATIHAVLLARLDIGGTFDNIQFNVDFRADTGSFGRYVTASIYREIGGVAGLTEIAYPHVIPGLSYTPGSALRARVQAVGPELRIRVWDPSEDEPSAWHAQGYDTEVSGTGIGCGVAVPGTPTEQPLPVTVHFSGLQAAPPTPADEGVRYVGEIASWEPEWPYGDLSHGDHQGEARVTVTAAGILRRMGQGASPLLSAMRRNILSHYPLAYWPCEDREGATEAGSALPGGASLRTQGWTFAQDDSLDGSRALPEIGEDARMQGVVPAPTSSTGGWSIYCVYLISADDWPEDEATVYAAYTTGTVALWSVRMETIADVRAFRVRGTDEDGTTVVNTTVNAETGDVASSDAWRQLRLRMRQDGSDVVWRLDWIDETGANWGIGDTLSGSIGHVLRVGAHHGGMPTGMRMGHISVWGASRTASYFGAFGGWAGLEDARGRLARLAMETDTPLEISGAADTAMGPQPSGTLLDLLQDAAEADGGILYESRHTAGLSYRGRDTLYNQNAVLELDAAADDRGDIVNPLAPVLDDQAIRNDVTVERSDGGEARAVDEDGPLGVATVGRYDTSVTLNVATDDQLPDQAAWRLHLGTWPGMRYPAVSPALAVQPGLIDRWVRLDVGDRVTVAGLPPQHPTDTVDLVAQGYAETIQPHRWDAEITASPGGPWLVFQVEDEVRGRLDTAGSELAVAVDSEDTELVIATDSTRQPWINSTDHASQFPFNLSVGGGEVVRVTGISGTNSPQTATVVRGVDGVQRAWPAGTRVRLSRSVVGL